MVDFRITYTLCIGEVRNAHRMNQRRMRVNQRQVRVWHLRAFVGACTLQNLASGGGACSL